MLDKWHTQDRDIIKYIDSHEGILITKDQDFRSSFLLNRTPRKLIKINLGNISNEALLHKIETNIDRISEMDEQHASFMIEINKDGYWIVTK